MSFTSMRTWLMGLAIVASSVGCSPHVESDDATEDELYAVPTEARPGEQRDILLSSVPALSRDASARSRGERDAIIATWHVHHVATVDGTNAVLVYGADAQSLVRLAMVIDDNASSVSIVEPSADEVLEPLPTALSRSPMQALAPDDQRWLGEELRRLQGEVGRSLGGGTRPQTFEMSGKCAARIATQVLALASLVVLSPAGGFVVNAIEAAAWGDFDAAVISAGITGTGAAGQALSESERVAVRRTGAVLKTTAKAVPVAMGVLAAAFLIRDPSAAAEMLAPPQCQAAEKN